MPLLIPIVNTEATVTFCSDNITTTSQLGLVVTRFKTIVHPKIIILLTHTLFQTCMNFFLLLNTK